MAIYYNVLGPGCWRWRMRMRPLTCVPRSMLLHSKFEEKIYCFGSRSLHSSDSFIHSCKIHRMFWRTCVHSNEWLCRVEWKSTVARKRSEKKPALNAFEHLQNERRFSRLRGGPGASLLDVCAFRQKRFNFYNLLCNWIHKIIYYYIVRRVWAIFNWIDSIWNSFRGWACDANGQQTFDNIEGRVHFNGNNKSINQIRFSADLSCAKRHTKITIFRLSNEERGICLPRVWVVIQAKTNFIDCD